MSQQTDMDAMKARAAKYPVAIHTEQGGNISKPSEFASIADDSFADPVNYKYPIDDVHVMAAWAYISKDENRAKGGYSEQEWTWMKNRVQKRMEAAGHTVAAQEALQRTPSSYYFFSESIKLDGNVVSGVAIHPKLIWHPESGVDFKSKHDYLKEELKKAAESLKGKPFGEDHLRLLPSPNIITEGHWDEQQNGVAFKGTVSDNVAQNIGNKEYKGISVEIDWKKPGKYVMLEKTNGTAPRNFDFTSVHFLRRFPPGDKEAYVKLMEGIVLPIVPPSVDAQIDLIKELLEERIQPLEAQLSLIHI